MSALFRLKILHIRQSSFIGLDVVIVLYPVPSQRQTCQERSFRPCCMPHLKPAVWANIPTHDVEAERQF